MADGLNVTFKMIITVELLLEQAGMRKRAARGLEQCFPTVWFIGGESSEQKQEEVDAEGVEYTVSSEAGTRELEAWTVFLEFVQKTKEEGEENNTGYMYMFF